VHDFFSNSNYTPRGLLIDIVERKGLTVCITCVWAGVDNTWEQEKLKARKMLVNRAESHTSGARFVGQLCAYQNTD
jgi:hypothetical protein